MPHHFTKSCPVCEHQGFTEFLTCTDFFTTGETFDIKRCNQCGFLFTQNFPSESIIGKYYEVPDYVSHSDTKSGIVNYLYHFARKLMLSKKAGLVESIQGKTKGALLDYGSGTGYFVRAMAARQWQTIAIEKSGAARNFALSEFSTKSFEPDYLTEIADQSLDVVTLWHVLEHLEHLDLMVEQFKRVLKPNGILILALPNSKSFDAGFYQEYWAAYDVPRHLWHFDPTTIKRFGEKHQLKLVKSKGMKLDAFYIAMLSEKNKGSKFGFIRGMFVGLFTFFVSIFDQEKHSSMIYVFKK